MKAAQKCCFFYNMTKVNKFKEKIIGSVHGSSLGYILDNLKCDYKRVLVILKNNNDLYELEKEINIFKRNKYRVSIYPDYETVPYENINIDTSILSSRIKTGLNYLNSDSWIIVTTISCLKKYQSIHPFTKDYFFKIDIQTEYNDLIKKLNQMMFVKTNRVLERGQYAIKGPIIDIFSACSEIPVRVIFNDNKIEKMKLFDLNNQITISEVTQTIISYNHEIIINNDDQKFFTSESLKIFGNEFSEEILYKNIKDNYSESNYDLIPVIYKKPFKLLDIIDAKTLILHSDNISEECQLLDDKYLKYYSEFSDSKYIIHPDKLLVDSNKIKKHFDKSDIYSISSYNIETNIDSKNYPIKKIYPLLIDNKTKEPFNNLNKFLNMNIYSIIICIEKNSLFYKLCNFFESNNINFNYIKSFYDFKKNKISILHDEISEGFIDYEKKIAVVSSKDIFGKYMMQQNKKNYSSIFDEHINDISSIKINDPIVHEIHGVGRYKGLMNMTVEDIKTELIKIEYADNDLLYIPVTSIDLLRKFTTHSKHKAPLHSLGSTKWEKTKKRAKTKINDIAVEILEIESKRKYKKGFSFSVDNNDYENFTKDFPFTETPDQERTILEIINDMKSANPMDRIICGDVGFGKTEVFMRACYIAAMNSTQVLVLAPTTILVEQHYKNFKKRFINTPIKIGRLSRLARSKEKNQSLIDIENGNIDIIIGTHAALSSGIIFNNLRLLVVDEEHRFGVRAKEKIKKIKSSIDVLSLTATPIPRTLNAALSSFRDLSLIETPPENRKSIITKITEWDDNIIRDSIEREVDRGGQIYFVHNDIKTMNSIKLKLSMISPKLNIGIIHAQLDNREIENQMNKFINKEYDLVICSSIIESGLDITNVNTIIINDCHKFGLSQLHQIRGRVGRTSRQAYSYLIIPNKYKISSVAQKRLDAIDSVNSLGGGFEIATHDLEIRGAGELLGDEQSGQIYEIGYALYIQLLNQAIELNKSGNIKMPSSYDIEINKPCLIPEMYIDDIYMRLKYYRMISSCKDENELEELLFTIQDIYGPVPEELNNLLIISLMKQKLSDKNIQRLKIYNDSVTIQLNKESVLKFSLESDDLRTNCDEIIERVNNSN